MPEGSTVVVILAGDVGAAPDAHTTRGGTKITHFSLATSRPKRDNNGKIFEQYVDKGMKVMVRGRIHYTRWTDIENIERYGVEIIADEVTFLIRAMPASGDQDGNDSSVNDDDTPFWEQHRPGGISHWACAADFGSRAVAWNGVNPKRALR